jgi:perosamine synthetase
MLGRPVVAPSFIATTLDKDDVSLAKQWLSNRSNWSNQQTVLEYETEFAKWNGSK